MSLPSFSYFVLLGVLSANAFHASSQFYLSLMRLKLYCNRYAHFKDALVCSVSCAYRTRCRDFALFYDAHRDATDALVADYYSARRTEVAPSVPRRTVLPVVALNQLIKLEVKRVLEATYVWVDKDDHAETLSTEEVIARAERGLKAKHIYKVAQEMELKFQLVPRRGIDKAKSEVSREAHVQAARRAASSSSRPRLIEPENVAAPIVATVPTGETNVGAPPARRRRVARVAGER
ncbi:MAG: hypothetical protein MSG64_06245 [Pyrinomonadaceae bacterium MAG19_C2-C3]|nr:hypothetical protein [Pyrinomonadaceae bacterium MAG19_C2-C3]